MTAVAQKLLKKKMYGYMSVLNFKNFKLRTIRINGWESEYALKRLEII